MRRIVKAIIKTSHASQFDGKELEVVSMSMSGVYEASRRGPLYGEITCLVPFRGYDENGMPVGKMIRQTFTSSEIVSITL